MSFGRLENHRCSTSIISFKSAGTFDLVVSCTGQVCSNGGGPSVIFGGKFVLFGNSTALGGVGVVLADQDDLAIDDIFSESPISCSVFVLFKLEASPGGKEEGPFPFILLPLLKFARVADANDAVYGEHDDDGEEEDVVAALELMTPPGNGPPDATPAGRVYEHWYVERPPRVRSSRIASSFMPVFKHFSNLHAGHFFLVAIDIGHCAPRRQT